MCVQASVSQKKPIVKWVIYFIYLLFCLSVLFIVNFIVNKLRWKNSAANSFTAIYFKVLVWLLIGESMTSFSKIGYYLRFEPMILALRVRTYIFRISKYELLCHLLLRYLLRRGSRIYMFFFKIKIQLSFTFETGQLIAWVVTRWAGFRTLLNNDVTVTFFKRLIF